MKNEFIRSRNIVAALIIVFALIAVTNYFIDPELKPWSTLWALLLPVYTKWMKRKRQSILSKS